MSRLTKYFTDGDEYGYNLCHGGCESCNGVLCGNALEMIKKLAHYEDLEEQGRLIDWKRTSEEKPGSTRHVIVADGAIISHYGYYLKPKDKWFTDWTCEKEIDAPMFWADMPEPPEESLHSDCCAKMDEVE